MAFNAELPVAVDVGAAEPLGATDLSDGSGLPEATCADVGAGGLMLAALDWGADPVAPPEIRPLAAGTDSTVAEDVGDTVAVPVAVELHPVSSRPAAAAHTNGVRMIKVIIGEQ